MSETTAVETAASEAVASNGEPTAAPKAAPRPRKSSKPKAAVKLGKKAVRKTVKTSAGKPKRSARKSDWSNGKPLTGRQIGGLRLGQVRILDALKKTSKPLTRVECAARGKVTVGWAFNHLGATDESQRKVTEKRTGYPSLLTLKYVRTYELEVAGKNERVYEITATGKKALAKAKNG